MATILALVSSLAWGSADFIGGQFSKRYPAFFVVFVAQAFGLVLMLIVATLTGAWSTPTDYLPWAVLASVSGFIGLGLFYVAMATGAVGVVSPITALGGLGPIVLGLATRVFLVDRGRLVDEIDPDRVSEAQVLAALGAAPLFQGSGAFDMAVAAGASLQALASGLGPWQSDGRNALRFSGIGRSSLGALDGEDPQGFLAVIVSEAGHEAKVASDRSAASERVLDALEAHREGVSGVSMEEEVANMIRFQRGFEAASRYLSVLNGLSDELMRMLG